MYVLYEHFLITVRVVKHDEYCCEVFIVLVVWYVH